MNYVHASGPNGCRKNCACCKQERMEANLKAAYRMAGQSRAKKLNENDVRDLVIAALRVYDDANDRGETHNGDGKEYADFEALRLALEKFKAIKEAVR